MKLQCKCSLSQNHNVIVQGRKVIVWIYMAQNKKDEYSVQNLQSKYSQSQNQCEYLLP